MIIDRRQKIKKKNTKITETHSEDFITDAKQRQKGPSTENDKFRRRARDFAKHRWESGATGEEEAERRF